MATYSVRVSGAIAARGAGLNTRRRAGLAFGPAATLVSADGGEGAAVTEAQLAAIKADPHLRVKEVAPPAPPAAAAPRDPLAEAWDNSADAAAFDEQPSEPAAEPAEEQAHESLPPEPEPSPATAAKPKRGRGRGRPKKG